MPSTRQQKEKARKSREMDMMSDFENLIVIHGNEITNPIERELSDVIGNSEHRCDVESDSLFRGITPRKIISGNMAMNVQFQGKVGSRKQWKLLLVNLT